MPALFSVPVGESWVCERSKLFLGLPTSFVAKPGWYAESDRKLKEKKSLLNG